MRKIREIGRRSRELCHSASVLFTTVLVLSLFFAVLVVGGVCKILSYPFRKLHGLAVCAREKRTEND